MKKKIISIALSLSVLISGASAFADGLNWSIKESNSVGYANKELYGINFEWGDADSADTTIGFLWDMYGNPIDLGKELNYYKFPYNRMAGGSANNFYWKNQLGPLVTRIPHKQDLQQLGKVEGSYTNRRFGGRDNLKGNIASWVKAVRSSDPDAKFGFVVNFLWDDVENVADLVEYMIGDGTVNYNGGVNWAQVRINEGVKEPVDVICWELGNEVDLFGVDVDTYIEGAKKAIAAIRSVDPDANIAAHVATNDTSAVGQQWIRQVLKEIGNDIDTIAMHKYYELKNVCRVAEPMVCDVIEDLELLGLKDRIKINFTEHALSFVTSYPGRGTVWPRSRTLEGVLNEVDYFSRMWNYPNVVGANYHGYTTGPWSLVYYDYDGKLKPTAILDLLQVYIDKGVGEVLENKLEGFVANAPADVVGNVVKTEKGMNIFVANIAETPIKLNFEFENKYTLKGQTHITGESLAAKNWYGEKGISQTYTEFNTGEEFTEFDLPGLSIMVLELEKIN